MGYYVRVLSTSAACVPLSSLHSTLQKHGLRATLTAEEHASDDWKQLTLSHDDGREIASLERNLVEEGSLGSEELTEFAEDGYHILWEFSDSVDGPWWMGVLREGQWRHFRMDLGNRKHREAFLQGQVPDGVELA